MEEHPLSSPQQAAAPPDGAACWAGAWQRVPVLTDVWAQAALLRTVAALPALHPWRLGDAKGSARQLQWVARRPGLSEDPVLQGLYDQARRPTS